MRWTALLAVAAAASAFTDAAPEPRPIPKPARSAQTAPAKPGAPVEVRSAVSSDRVRLELRFGSAGSDVAVSLWGTDGLIVAGDSQPVRGRRVAAGETLTLEVKVEPGPGHSNLAVLVSGAFAGVPRSRVASVSFGTLQRDDVRAFRRSDDGHGQPLKVGRGEIR